jgi:glycosyltransferase involved in cell wall biosynthesis
MKVSIIITTYKRSNYLREAIESVLAQNFKDFELIVVNDDPVGHEAEKIILSFNDPRIVYLKNEKNLGGAKSLNVGLKRAKGDYVAILDDDDVWLSKDKLQKQTKFLEENPEYIIVGTSSINVDGKTGKEISRYMGKLGTNNIEKFLLTRVPFAHSSVLYRRKVIVSVGGYSEDLPRAKDIDLYLKIFKLGKFGFLKECFIKYREVSLGAKDIIKKRCLDSFFYKKVIYRHRKDFPYVYFLNSYLKISLRYLMFKVLIFFSLPYKIYRKIRYD